MVDVLAWLRSGRGVRGGALGSALLSACLMSSCKDPFRFDATTQTPAGSDAGTSDPSAGAEMEVCPDNPADLDAWLPMTPPVPQFKPLPHPATECPFYKASWQNFLVATQPDAQGRPAFLTWATVHTLFGGAVAPAANAVPFLDGGITQAGGRQVLVDQNGQAIRYGIHVNQPFVDFVTTNALTSVDAVRAADPRLYFPAGVVELKSAWQIVDANAPPAGYVTAKVQVPTLKMAAGALTEDRTAPREVTVALLALHVVFTLPGHPEFIWSTFEHVDADGNGDVAPSAPANPDQMKDDTVVSMQSTSLFKAGTTVASGNEGLTTPRLDEATQTFQNDRSSIYRLYPASKSNTTDTDDAIVSLNKNVRDLFARTKLSDVDARRGHYRLVGAVWLDKPDVFAADKELANDESDPDIQMNGSDSDHSILAGEDRLSSTAMESFTQGADAFPNCFSCHDTRAATARGVPSERDQTAAVILQPKQINVSHVFTEVVRGL